MQFVTNGPNIPDKLLQAHEEGRVVFFCGAGISYPAGLPGFKGLVDEIYRVIGTSPTEVEQDAYLRNQFDVTLDLLERRLPGQRIAVRKALEKVLQPKLHRKKATDMHTALLQLARDRRGTLRLVTTNFDRIFEYVIKRDKLQISSYVAPMLPVPKNSRWNGLVYLHGLLPDNGDESMLHRLVLTSGDFGLAYLTERWAARFVSELFRNYVVCFVGYSINDPVLRYMMDALAADRMLGEVTTQAYAFGHYEPGEKHSKTIEWESKGVTPILYEVSSNSHDHLLLHSTLKAWAEIYRDGILGKERIVISYALAQPTASTCQDDFIGRMLWALSDESGLPAKRFAEFNPVPTLAWLEVFSEERYEYTDLSRFGVTSLISADDQLRFSLINRPTPYNYAPWMSFVSDSTSIGKWDSVMYHLSRWLISHLNDPKLIIWLAQHGGQLHSNLVRMIENEMDRFSKLEEEGKTIELEEIRANAPNAIPGPLMKKLWRLLLTGRVKSPRENMDLFNWINRLKRDGLTITLRLELRELLAPKVILRKPFYLAKIDNAETPEHINQLVDCELVLDTDHVYYLIRNIDDVRWHEALPKLLDDFQQLLRDALDLLCELGEANDHYDCSSMDLPSITPHWQNRGFHDWVILIELLRDAWLSLLENNHEQATGIAQSWFRLPYPTFKRLALFAASKDECITPDQWVDWLTSDEAWWLWSPNTKREVMRLLILQGVNLSLTARTKLEEAILAGPPRDMYKDDLDPKEWQLIAEHSIWLRLAKLREGAGELANTATQRFNELSTANPEWKLASDERDEFSYWMSVTGDPDYEFKREIDITPRKRKDLVKWLKQKLNVQRPFYEDNWHEICRTRFYHSIYALCDLAQERIWPRERWSEALQVWSEENMVFRSWRFAAPLVRTMPDDVLQEVAHSITRWIEAVSKSNNLHNENILLDLCRRILTLPYQPEADSDEPVTQAINHPVGKVTQTLLNLWMKRKPNDNDKLPGDIESFFTQLCNVEVRQFRHGRVLLASRVISLFRVDRPWTETHLLPLFDWETDVVEAKAVWEGFLWSPRLFQPLLIALKSQFLETARHYIELGKHRRQFAALLTLAALNSIDGYTNQEFQLAIGALPQEGLQEVARMLLHALEGAGEQREDYLKNRIRPFWINLWPKSRNFVSDGIAKYLARLCIEARGEFSNTLLMVLYWLQPIKHPDYVVNLLHDSGLVKRFPMDALKFLELIIDNPLWVPNKLKQCLDEIVSVTPQVIEDPGYIRLNEYLQRNGK